MEWNTLGREGERRLKNIQTTMCFFGHVLAQQDPISASLFEVMRLCKARASCPAPDALNGLLVGNCSNV